VSRLVVLLISVTKLATWRVMPKTWQTRQLVVHRTKSDSEGIQNPLQGLCGSQNDAKNAAETVAGNLEGIWLVQEGRTKVLSKIF
jgi:hypothetical protein